MPACLPVFDEDFLPSSHLYRDLCDVDIPMRMHSHLVDAFQPIVDELALVVESARLPKEADLDVCI